MTALPAWTCIFALLLYSAQAKAVYCVQDWACSEVTKAAGQWHFWLENRKAYPITQTLYVKAKNLRSQTHLQNSYEVTRVLHGHERIKVLTLTPADSTREIDFSDEFYWTPGDMHAQHDNRVRYLKPYAKDSYYRIVQGFGGGYSHTGASRYAVDFAMPVGTPVHAARSGMVIDVAEHNDKGGASRRYARYANFIVVLHDDGTTGEYYHLQKNGALVDVGEQVAAGQHIGYSGNTGFSSLPHLHFAVYRAKSWGKYESLPFKFAK